jgi:hypothetical protein
MTQLLQPCQSNQVFSSRPEVGKPRNFRLDYNPGTFFNEATKLDPKRSVYVHVIERLHMPSGDARTYTMPLLALPLTGSGAPPACPTVHIHSVHVQNWEISKGSFQLRHRDVLRRGYLIPSTRHIRASRRMT